MKLQKHSRIHLTDAAEADYLQLETANLRAQIERLQEVNRGLSRENEDLAGRLLTAQIRRLEAEKALLENLIAAEQAGSLPSSIASGTGASSTPTQP